MITRRELAALTAPEAEAWLIHALLAGEAVPDVDDEAGTVHRHRLVYRAIREPRDLARAHARAKATRGGQVEQPGAGR